MVFVDEKARGWSVVPRCVLLSVILLGVTSCLMATTTPASAALVYEYVAGSSPDDGSDTVWEASVENPSFPRNWSLSGATFLANAGSSHAGISSAYSFSGSSSGGSNSSFGSTEFPLGGTAGNNEGASTAWEIWVRPSAATLDAIGDETLFETGGNAEGGHLAFVAATGGVTLRFRTGQSDSGNVTTATVDASLTDNSLLNDFMQIVGVVDPSATQMRLYVNGSLVGSEGSFKDWQGGNNASGLGKVNGDFGGANGVTAGAGNFAGDIARLSLYDDALSDAEVSQLYTTVVTVPEPTSQALFLLGLGVGVAVRHARRRRHRGA